MTSIRRAFIQEQGQDQLEIEEQLVFQALSDRPIPITLYTPKRIKRRQLPLSPDTLVVGDLDCVLGALRQLEITPPPMPAYPPSLKSLLHRRVWKSEDGAG